MEKEKIKEDMNKETLKEKAERIRQETAYEEGGHQKIGRKK